MRKKAGLLMILMVVLSMSGFTAAFAADSPKLAAPIYPGAVPGVLADGVKVDPSHVGVFNGVKALDCKGVDSTPESVPGPWCFLTRDPIEKVKAYYDKAVGKMYPLQGERNHIPVQGYAVSAERAWFQGGDDYSPSFHYNSVSLHALPAPPVMGQEAKNTDDTWEGQEAYKFYGGTRHFSGFIEGVDWFGDPTKHKQAELDAIYKKHKGLESVLFQHKGPKSEAVDETLREHFLALQIQGQKKAQSNMVPSAAQISQMRQAATTPMPANQQATPEDEEFKAFMKKNPKVANRYVELTRKMGTLIQQGKLDEADEVDEEMQALVDGNPELAAIQRREEERSSAISAKSLAQENSTMANYNKLMDQALWSNWVDYISAAEKENHYYTLIVIDSGFKGNEKNYSRDPALLARETTGWVPHNVWGFNYENQSKNPSTESETAPQDKTGTKADIKKSLKKGLNKLKGLF